MPRVWHFSAFDSHQLERAYHNLSIIINYSLPILGMDIITINFGSKRTAAFMNCDCGGQNVFSILTDTYLRNSRRNVQGFASPSYFSSDMSCKPNSIGSFERLVFVHNVHTHSAVYSYCEICRACSFSCSMLYVPNDIPVV